MKMKKMIATKTAAVVTNMDSVSSLCRKLNANGLPRLQVRRYRPRPAFCRINVETLQEVLDTILMTYLTLNRLRLWPRWAASGRLQVGDDTSSVRQPPARVPFANSSRLCRQSWVADYPELLNSNTCRR